MDKIYIGGVEFPKNVFERNLNVFREGLAHSSLSCEKIFDELYEVEEKTNCLKEKNSKQIYDSLSKEEQLKITQKIRYFVIYSAMHVSVITEQVEENEQEKINNLYLAYFSYFDEWIYEVLVFENNQWDMKKTYQNIVQLFHRLPQFKMVYKKASQMKADHIAAFDYALEKEYIGVNEIVKINTIVNQSQPEKEIGFKKVNNIIEGGRVSEN